MKNEGIEVTEEQINSLAEKNVKEEIKRGVQIFTVVRLLH